MIVSMAETRKNVFDSDVGIVKTTRLLLPTTMLELIDQGSGFFFVGGSGFSTLPRSGFFLW